MSGARFIVADVFDGLAALEAEGTTVDLVLTSPPFLALRSYLPADHPDKAREIGSEGTPAVFLDVLLDVVEACAGVLARHGSICFELGDTYSGSGGGGGDYLEGGIREGQAQFAGSAASMRESNAAHWRAKNTDRDAWPLAKSLCMIPGLFAASLAYGRNLLNPQHTFEPWRVRNLVAWCLDGDTVLYARTPKGEGPTRLLHLTQNWQPGQWELWDGERWTPVLGWSTTEANDAIEIEFRNGETISATRNHEWPTARGVLRTDQLVVGDVVSTVTLPEPLDATDAEHLPDDVVGWLVGTFVADGSFDSRDRIQISSHHDETPARLAALSRLAEAFDGTCTAHYHDGKSATVIVRSPVLAAVLRRYVGGDSARNKHLRPPAWRRSNRFLRAVADGYLAGDGHYDAKNDRWRLGFTDNGWLARDLRVLCARLGWRCRLKRLPRATDPRGGQFAGTARFCWRGEIRQTMNRDLAPSGQVVALRESRRRRFFDIGVEGEPHLFALGSGLLTHNCRPNPPVGALGDKVRPATSYVTWACKAQDRWFDLDAVRSPSDYDRPNLKGKGSRSGGTPGGQRPNGSDHTVNSAGAPPLDWWKISPTGYTGAHYAVFPPELCRIPIEASCPRRVCRTCGQPSRRIAETTGYSDRQGHDRSADARSWESGEDIGNRGSSVGRTDGGITTDRLTTGWSTCGCPDTDGIQLDGYHTGRGWRPGIVLDPFAGTGTTLLAATGRGRDAIGIDLDSRNARLVEERLGMWVTMEGL